MRDISRIDADKKPEYLPRITTEASATDMDWFFLSIIEEMIFGKATIHETKKRHDEKKI